MLEGEKSLGYTSKIYSAKLNICTSFRPLTSYDTPHLDTRLLVSLTFDIELEHFVAFLISKLSSLLIV